MRAKSGVERRTNPGLRRYYWFFSEKFLTLIKLSRFPPMTWEPGRVKLNHSNTESGQLRMPTQTDKASDYDFVINLIYERSLIRLHDGKHQMIRARRVKVMRHPAFEMLGQRVNRTMHLNLATGEVRLKISGQAQETILCKNSTTT